MTTTLWELSENILKKDTYPGEKKIDKMTSLGAKSVDKGGKIISR
jgi:hypothetical protein